MTGYEAFTIYNALKLHFSTDNYDYFKYNGKSNISIEAFENRKDKYYFYKLSRNNNKEDYIEFLVSNFLVDDKCWVGNLLQDEAQLNHKNRMSVLQSLTYKFREDCAFMRDNTKYPNELFRTDGEYPKVLTMTLQKDVNLETLVIMNTMMNFIPVWDKRITDTIRYPEFSRKVKKYTPFISFDKEKFKSIIIKELL